MKVLNQKKMWLIALVGLFMLILAACGNDTSEQQPADSGSNQGEEQPKDEAQEKTAELPTIKVGMVCGGMTPLLGQIGIYDGSFEKAGVNAEEVCFSSGSDAVKALVGGGIDVNLGSYEHVLKMAANDLGVKAYGELYNGISYSLVVKKDAPYETPADLKGETLAVTRPGSMSDTGLRRGLEEDGLDPDKDVKIIGSGSGSTMLAAIESGKVAGGMVSEPTISQMVATGDYRVLYEPTFDYAGIIVMAKSDWVNENKEAMKIFLNEMVEINKRAKEDPKHVVETMQDQFENVPADVLEEAVQKTMAKVPEGLKVTKPGAEAVNEIAVQLEIIKEPVPFEDAVDLSLLP